MKILYKPIDVNLTSKSSNMITLHALSNLVLVPTRERNLDLDIINKPIDVNHQNSRQIPLFSLRIY